MAFPKKYLNDNEAIVLERNPHIWYLAKPFTAILAAVGAGVAAALLINPTDGKVNGWISWATLILPMLALVWFLKLFTQWRTTNFVITTDRLIYRHGVVAKKGMEIPLERINNIASNQSFFERVLRVGDLQIESGGEDGKQIISNVSKPFEIQNRIYAEVERSKARDLDRAAGARTLSVPEQIEKLADLVTKGVVTQAEFDAKKSQLLDKM
jgi:uncharacterized membrane protein YdbT with pleckstrin-like domain